MAYGLQINKADGSNIYDSSAVTWLQVGQFEFAANESRVITWSPQIPSNFELMTQVQMVDVPPDDQEGFIPDVDLNFLRLDVAPFSGQTSVRVIVIVLAKG